MTDTNTTNLNLLLMATGGDTNAWGANLNNSVIQILDQALGSKLSLSVAGSSNVTLTTSQSQNLYFNFTGILTGNINVIYPASAGRLIIVNNATTGAFTLTITPSGGTGFLVTQGSTQMVLIDGATNTAMAAQNDILPLEVTLASATTTNLGATGTNVVAISGTTTITSFGSSAALTECLYWVRFTGILTLTQNATSLILPGGVSITTAAGDCALMKYEGSGNWRCMFYTKAAGSAVKFSSIAVQTFTSSGTYTPTANMAFCIIECVGPGGGGGGVQTSSSSQTVNGGGGGGGGYARVTVTAAAIGASKVVTVGTGGAGGVGVNNGVAGSGSTSLGTLCVASAGGFGGGNGGGLSGGGAGGVGTTGDVLVSGGQGTNGFFSTNATGFFTGGNGGTSYFSGGVNTNYAAGNVAPGVTATSPGGGGSGAWAQANTGSGTGGAGANGIVIITEYIAT